MELILWRHAEAADGVPDRERPLTAHGHAQARAIADWLTRRMPPETRVLVSPARRAQETAAALKRPFETTEALGPETSPDAVIEAVGWPGASTAVLIVGHQPTLGEVAAQLLGAAGREMPVRKGAVVWIKSPRRRVRDPATLVRVKEPSML